MGIKKETPKGNFKLILTALIVNDEFLYKFNDKYNSDFFDASFAQHIADWALDFYKEYKEAPKSHIQDLYDEAIRKNQIESSELELIEDLLNSIADDYTGEDMNIKYLLNETKKLQQEQDLQNLKEELSLAIEDGEFDEAQKLIEDHRVIENVDDIKFVEVLKDNNAYNEINKALQPPLIHFGGALGEMLDKEIVRGSYTAIRGVPKACKTFLANEICNRGILARKNVVMIQAGDLNKSQAYARFFSVVGGVPKFPLPNDHTRPYIDCYNSWTNSCGMINRKTIGQSIVDENGNLLPYDMIPKEYEPCTWCHMKGKKFPLRIFRKPYKCDNHFDEEVIQKIQKRALLRLRNKRFFLLPVKSRSINMRDIETRLLKLYEEEGFKPDIVVIDYDGILKAEEGNLEKRHDIALKCSIARSMSFTFDCSMVVFEQSNRQGYGALNLQMDNASEARERNDEPTCVIGLVPDRKNKLLRLNKMASRDYDFNPSDSVVLLPDLNCGRIHLDSYWEYEIDQKEENIKEKFNKDEKKT